MAHFNVFHSEFFRYLHSFYLLYSDSIWSSNISSLTFLSGNLEQGKLHLDVLNVDVSLCIKLLHIMFNLLHRNKILLCILKKYFGI